jgi:hypothetical protein
MPLLLQHGAFKAGTAIEKLVVGGMAQGIVEYKAGS